MCILYNWITFHLQQVKANEGQGGEDLENNVQASQVDTSIDTLLVAATNSLTGSTQNTAGYSMEETYQTDTSGVITNVVSLEEVSKTVSIESLLANQARFTHFFQNKIVELNVISLKL